MTYSSFDVPLARDDPPWTYIGPRSDPDRGSVFVWPAPRGASVLTFDRRGRRHALTLLAGAPGGEIVIYGRRFSVVTDHALEELV